MRVVKIYTKTGDKGETGLLSGERISKDAPRIAAYGDIDELNAVLGICRCANKDAFLEKILHQLQAELFMAGADLSTPLTAKVQIERIEASNVSQLESWIDGIDETVDPLKNFILPGGSHTAGYLHLARTVCRRAERSITALQKQENIGENVLKYVNRLSDLLFMMARYSNKVENVLEEKWKGLTP